MAESKLNEEEMPAVRTTSYQTMYQRPYKVSK